MPGRSVWLRVLGMVDSVLERLVEEPDGSVVAHVRPKRRQQRRCGICCRRGPLYDQGEGRRRWRGLDVGCTRFLLEAAAPRVTCREHGVVVAQVPWARHRSRYLRAFEDQVAWLATQCSQKACSQLMRLDWETVGRIIRPRLLVAAKVFVRTLKPSSGREAAGAAMVNLFRAVGSPAYPLDEDWLREVGRRSYDRDPGRLGMRRQEQAIRASRDLRHELASLRVPTLVLHGEADPAISVNAGRATMRAIPGARLVTYPGMGHDLPGALWPAIVAEIWALAVRATSAHGSQT